MAASFSFNHISTERIHNVDRKVRAFAGLGAFAEVSRKPIFVHSISTWFENHCYPAGHLVEDAGSGPVVAVADGFALLSNFEHIAQ
jgi:hypothetical protein